MRGGVGSDEHRHRLEQWLQAEHNDDGAFAGSAPAALRGTRALILLNRGRVGGCASSSCGREGVVESRDDLTVISEPVSQPFIGNCATSG